MRTLITLFVCCLAAGAAQANDPPGAAKAEPPKGELAKADAAAKAAPKSEAKPCNCPPGDLMCAMKCSTN